MSNGTKWLIVAAIILVLAGGSYGVWAWNDSKRRKLNAPDVPNTPSDGLDPNNYLTPANSSGSTGNNAAADAILVSVESSQARAAIAKQAELIENNSRLSSVVRARYEIGNQLFDGINASQAEYIKNSFHETVGGLDKDNYMEYPIYGEYSRPALKLELERFIANFPNGIAINTTEFKYNWYDATQRFTPERGYLPSLNYCILSGTATEFKGSEADYTYLTNTGGLAGVTVAKAGQVPNITLLKFAKNWLAEVKRYNQFIWLEAINVCLRNGWRFKEYSEPTTKDLIN